MNTCSIFPQLVTMPISPQLLIHSQLGVGLLDYVYPCLPKRSNLTHIVQMGGSTTNGLLEEINRRSFTSYW